MIDSESFNDKNENIHIVSLKQISSIKTFSSSEFLTNLLIVFSSVTSRNVENFSQIELNKRMRTCIEGRYTCVLWDVYIVMICKILVQSHCHCQFWFSSNNE